MSVSENIHLIRHRIKETCLGCGRDSDDIILVAATKTVLPDNILEAIESGISIIGENRVQEAKRKKTVISKNINWHMIGHLQKNKVNTAVKLFDMIQSVDTVELARKISNSAKLLDKTVEILIEVNISEEYSKNGVLPDNLQTLINEVSAFDCIKVRGLMTLAAYCEEVEQTRILFKKMRILFEKYHSYYSDRKGVLSMGMSHDYLTAIEEGSTMIRLGYAMFGEREYV